MPVPEAANARDIVLLVDDSPEALGFLTEALEQSGFSVLIATSGNAALNIADRITPDIILLDAVMLAIRSWPGIRNHLDAASITVPNYAIHQGGPGKGLRYCYSAQ